MPAPVPEPVDSGQAFGGPVGLKLSATLTEGGEQVTDGVHFKVRELGSDGSPGAYISDQWGSPFLELEPGTYRVEVSYDLAGAEADVEVLDKGTTRHTFVLDAGYLRPQALLKQGGTRVTEGVLFNLYEMQTDLQGNRRRLADRWGKPVFYVNAGTYHLTTVYDLAQEEQDVEVKAGEISDPVAVLNAGYLKPHAVLMAGGEQVSDGVLFNLYETKTDLHGNRRRLADRWGAPLFYVGEGKYLLDVRYGNAHADQEVEITADELLEPTVVLDAGYLRPTAVRKDGAEPITDGVQFIVSEAKQDLHGKRRGVADAWNSPLFNLNAGRYYVTVAFGNASAAQELEIKAGEMLEPTIVLNAGELRPTAVLDGKPVTEGVNFAVYEAAQDLHGKRRGIADAWGAPAFQVNAGTYLIHAQQGGAQADLEVEVKAGESVAPELTLVAPQ